MQLKVKLLNDKAMSPKVHLGACWDIYSAEDVSFLPGEIKLVGCGFAIETSPGYRFNLYLRSSTPINKGFILANSVGIIDPSYRGEIKIQLMNIKNQAEIIPGGYNLQWLPNEVKIGDRLAQLELVPCHFDESFDLKPTIVDELSETKRNSGGFGSTG